MGRLPVLANAGQKDFTENNQLITDIERNGYTGIGKPEPLRGDLTGWWSRQIDEKNRIVYRFNEGNVEISQCRGHYDDK